MTPRGGVAPIPNAEWLEACQAADELARTGIALRRDRRLVIAAWCREDAEALEALAEVLEAEQRPNAGREVRYSVARLRASAERLEREDSSGEVLT